MYLPWTHDEKRSMVEAYRRMHLARCPNDRALLTVTDARTGQTPTGGNTLSCVSPAPPAGAVSSRTKSNPTRDPPHHEQGLCWCNAIG